MKDINREKIDLVTNSNRPYINMSHKEYMNKLKIGVLCQNEKDI